MSLWERLEGWDETQMLGLVKTIPDTLQRGPGRLFRVVLDRDGRWLRPKEWYWVSLMLWQPDWEKVVWSEGYQWVWKEDESAPQKKK